MKILKESNFVYFDVNLTPEEKLSIDGVDIKKPLPPFDSYGPVSDELIKNLTNYFNELGQNSQETTKTISELVGRVSKIALKDFGKESAWVAIRVLLPTHEFDIPRWHIDARNLQSLKSETKVYKLILTIKGSPTIFGETSNPGKFKQLTEENLKNYELNHDSDFELFKKEDIRIRMELDSLVKKIDKYEMKEAMYYLVANEDATIHSEPKIDEPRIVMSVVPGSNEQMTGLKEEGLKLRERKNIKGYIIKE
jgi:hypothetical protein